MVRKKVTSEVIKVSAPRKRALVTDTEQRKGQVILPWDGKTTKWNKVKGVTGQIVRYPMGDREKANEIGQLVQKGKAKSMYSALDGEIMYFYFEIIKE